MPLALTGGAVFLLSHLVIEAAVIVRILLRPHREPAARIAWLLVVLALPVVGILSYALFGEVNIGRKRKARLGQILAAMPIFPSARLGDEERLEACLPEKYEHLFRCGQSISGFEVLGGNTASLLDNSSAAIDALVADIDRAQDHVHLIFYIWLADVSGLKVAAALERAAGRGVTCRAMADDLGSRLMIRSRHWAQMRKAGVKLAAALPLSSLLLSPWQGRVDLRNHRKIVVIDGRITYCGSQNCADAEFRIKPQYAPWVDVMLRFEGPVAAQNQRVFASDWMLHVDEDLTELLRQPIPTPASGLPAQVVATGPTERYSAMPEMFECLMHAARRELWITSPYYVPDESLLNALCATAYRGVDTHIIFPARNDSWIVAAASRSYYSDLLSAGVIIHEYEGGLLHTKSLTLDGEVSLIGSANMDRRSFDLNYENNILFWDPALTGKMRRRQQEYMAHSRLVTPEEVTAWSIPRRLGNTSIGMLGPLL